MNQNEKVYITVLRDSKGHVVGVFSSVDFADIVNREQFDGEGSFAPRLLDDMFEKTKQGLKFFYVIALLNEDKIICNKCTVALPHECYRPSDCSPYMAMSIWAKDEKDAIRMAKEKRDKYLLEFNFEDDR